jgi:hypothetical protein
MEPAETREVVAFREAYVQTVETFTLITIWEALQ